jgi:menaquinone-dependent protoporphyrinogen oxidase
MGRRERTGESGGPAPHRRGGRPAGSGVTVIPPEEVRGIDGYDAMIIGSAVNMGHWLDHAKQLVNRFGDALAGRPVWLFSSGPVGKPSSKLASRWTKIPSIFPRCSRRPTRGITGGSLASSTGEF